MVARAISPGDLIINAIQITGGPGLTDNDFINIYNPTANIIDLNGLRLVKRTKTGVTDTTIKSWTSPALLDPGAIYTWANSSNGFAASLNANASSTQTLSNDNAVALRFGAENSGLIIDGVGWGAAANALVEGSPFPQNPGANEYIQRINFEDSNNNSNDFHLVQPIIFPVCGNTSIEGSETCDDGNTISGDGCDSSCQLEIPITNVPTCGNHIIEASETCDDGNIISGDGCSAVCIIEIVPAIPPIAPPVPKIYINEFVVDPVTGGNEWIELYSDATNAYDITNWTLEDGSGTKTKLSGTIGGDNHYFAIAKSSGSLNNDGDIIILRNPTGAIMTKVAYGNWDDGNIADNAPTASDPYGIDRLPDATEAKGDKDNYAVSSVFTMWATNIIVVPVIADDSTTGDNQSEAEPAYDYTKTITISEISANPIGIDSEHKNDEFIELYNYGDSSVNLEGWRLEVGAKQYIYEFPSGVNLASKKYLAVRAGSNFSLANTGAIIKLFQPSRATAYQTVTYKEAAEGYSWALVPNDSYVNKVWKWSARPTPGTINIIALPPSATFSIDGEKIVEKILSFDSSDSDAATSYLWDFGDKTSSTVASPQHAYMAAGSYNVTLTIKNNYGTSLLTKKIKITVSSLEKVETRADNETTDATEANGVTVASEIPQLHFVSVFPNPKGADGTKEWLEIMNDEVESVNLKGWRITAKNKKGALIDGSLIIPAEDRLKIPTKFLPTLGNTSETLSLIAPNGTIVDTVSYDHAKEEQLYSLTNNTWFWTTEGEAHDLKIVATGSAKKKKIKKTDQKSQTLSGLVASIPGTFSMQYFYLKLDAQELLYQIYNSKKLFPKLQLGQRIAVTGEQSEVADGPRFKTTVTADIAISGIEAVPTPAVITTAAAVVAPRPRLAHVEGEITSKKSPHLILTDATGDIEIYFSKGSGLSITNFSVGDKLSVTGITQLDGTAVRLMPRSENDITLLNAAAGPENSASMSSMEQNFNDNKRDSKKSQLPYIILASVVILSGGGYGIWRYFYKK